MVCTKFWTDSKVKQLTLTEKAIFLYLITNPHTHMSGLYYLPLSLATEELGTTVKWPAIWHRFADLQIAYYDDDQRLVWVCKMYGYQGKGENIAKSVARHLQSFHPSFLLSQFISMYGFIKPLLSKDFIQWVGEGVQEGVHNPLRTPSIPIPIPIPIPIHIPIPEERFEKEFWEPYPARDGKKIGKALALEKYRKLSEEDRGRIATAVQHLAAHPRSKDGIGIKDPHRWLLDGKGNEPWREWIEPTVETKKGGLHVGLNDKDYTAGTW